MAEFVMKKMVRSEGMEEEFEIASAATSREEIGNPVYPMARQELAKHGIGCPGHAAIFGDDHDGKVSRLLDHTAKPRDIADPWYTRDFRAAWNDISAGCEGLFAELKS